MTGFRNDFYIITGNPLTHRSQSIKEIGTIYHKANGDQEQFRAGSSVFISFSLNKDLSYLNCTFFPQLLPE